MVGQLIVEHKDNDKVGRKDLYLYFVSDDFRHELVFGVDSLSFLASCLSGNCIPTLAKEALARQYSFWAEEPRPYILINPTSMNNEWGLPLKRRD